MPIWFDLPTFAESIQHHLSFIKYISFCNQATSNEFFYIFDTRLQINNVCTCPSMFRINVISQMKDAYDTYNLCCILIHDNHHAPHKK